MSSSSLNSSSQTEKNKKRGPIDGDEDGDSALKRLRSSSDKPKSLTTTTSNTKLKLKAKPKPYSKPSNVLKEEDYEDALDRIIIRDYFPDLPKLKKQVEWLDAVAGNDLEKLKSIRTGTTNPCEYFQTPGSTIPSASNPEPPKNLMTDDNSVYSTKLSSNFLQNTSLESFLATYTSEDDASFAEIMKKQKEKRAKKLFWIEEKVKHAEKLLLPGTNNEEPKLLTWKYSATNPLMDNPESLPNTDLEKQSRKEINKSSTRLEEDDSELFKNPNDMTLTRSNTLIKRPESNYNSYLVSPNPLDGSMLDSPIVTWGNVAATPVRLDVDLSPGFTMKEISSKEKAGLKLAERSNKEFSRRKHKSKKTDENDSSGGRRLLDRIRSSSHSSKDQQLRQSYNSPALEKGKLRSFPGTPKTGIRYSTPSTKNLPHTPRLTSGFPSPSMPCTDNLLRLPKKNNNKT